jgi:hypothetical protein
MVTEPKTPKKVADLTAIANMVGEIKGAVNDNKTALADIRDWQETLEMRQRALEDMYDIDKMKKYMKNLETLSDVDIARRDAVLKKSITTTISELKDTAAEVQRMLQAQLVRATTMTEVIRFIDVEAPQDTYLSVQKLIAWLDKSDKWWMQKQHLRIWQWAALLVPKRRKNWEARFGKGLNMEMETDRRFDEGDFENDDVSNLVD